ncbi:uncharacterized protein PV09_07645 [Verruconis gallopava]|uniref:ubiquitinyl hydrolase 1 n=1 Tax=Verruconis gallopava TaxID=253628 RepID=A0A0D2A2A7_9PEZI|nr:uncharacterized protein PV09_07645 [Verruconis gallopava]KIW00893.1 hypothetical protein PV09_07645 [Verruconis gallopava]
MHSFPYLEVAVTMTRQKQHILRSWSERQISIGEGAPAAPSQGSISETLQEDLVHVETSDTAQPQAVPAASPLPSAQVSSEMTYQEKLKDLRSTADSSILTTSNPPAFVYHTQNAANTDAEISADNTATTSRGKRSRSLETTLANLHEKRPRAQGPPPIKLNEDDFHPPYKPLTDEERSSWKGWVEVLSEPIYMNTMLRDLGVRGVIAAEIVTLETSILSLEQPIYGLIFCFQYQDADHHVPAADVEPDRPAHVWFANQLPATNACATIAVLNILLNATEVELGKPLTYFKEDTKELSPMERAHCINEHEFIRAVHNSFASRMDIWIADRLFASRYREQVKKWKQRLKDEERAREARAKAAEKAARAMEKNQSPQQQTEKKTPRATRPKRDMMTTSAKKKYKYRKPRGNEDDCIGDDDSAGDAESEPAYDNESAFHYVAYVPVGGHVWRLDGMSAQPQDIGPYTHIDSWLFDAAPHIQSRMQAYEKNSGMLFNLMALVKDPIDSQREKLAGLVKALRFVEESLNKINVGWRSHAAHFGEDALQKMIEEFCITEEMIAASPTLEFETLDLGKLLKKRGEIAREQEQLKEELRLQIIRRKNEHIQVQKDRLDLNPTIHRVLLHLEENGKVHDLLERYR